MNKSVHVEKTFIFDFDGTLVNTFEPMIAALNYFAGDFGFSPLSAQQIEYFRGLPSKKIVSLLKLSYVEMVALTLKMRRFMKSKMHEVEFYPGMHGVIRDLKQQGYQLGIISSNSQANIQALLRRVDCNDFSFIHTSSVIFGKGVALKKVLNRYQLQTSQVYYIGDETRDIEAAKQCRVNAIAVSWGFNRREVLMASHPDQLLDSVDALRTL